MKCFIGLDIGTSAVKGALMAESGEVIKTETEKFRYDINGSFRTLDPVHFVDTCFTVISALAHGTENEIAAICSCCASGNPLFLDENLDPLTPIIGWQTEIPWEDLDKVYSKKEQDDIYRIIGWDFFDGMPAADLAWYSIHEPQILKKAKMLVMSAEYMNYQLPGEWGISHSMGTPFYLIDQEKGIYHKPLLDKFGLTEQMLPPIYEKGTVLGTVLPEKAEELGLTPDTKIVLGSFDHPSAAFGAGVFDPGDLLLSCGTSWVEFFPVDSREFGLSTGGLVDRFMINGTPYCVMKSIPSISDKIDALREHFFGKVPHAVFDGCAGEAKPGCNGLRFDFTESDFEKGKGRDKRDIARAVIESAAYKLKENLGELEKCGLHADRITAVGGITNSPVCTRIISEIMERDIGVINGQSAGAVGSCLLAAVGTGYFKTEKEAFAAMKEHLK